ncbi:hypothetical protein LUZ60_005904 [Juncus effusus]|nr:hypothetical protein LUZ60_005904 [Juncus effusus]
MAPSAGIEQKKNTKKNKSRSKDEEKKNLSKEEKKSKKSVKMDRDSAFEKSEPTKKTKKRKIDSTSEFNQVNDNDTINNTDKMQKKNKTKNEKKQKFNEDQQQEFYNEKDKTITDSRFSSSLHDPMFRRMKKKDSKIEIDSRFSKMFENKDFAGSSAPVDKRGKPKKDEKGKGLMSHYYLKQDNKKKIEEEEELERESDVSESDDDVSSTSDDESSSEDEYEDDDQNLGNHDISNYLMADHEDTPSIEKETHRLAIVNMVWDHIKAVDLYVVMTSCLPQGGRVESVTVYPSEFGMKCMEIEGSKGPGALMDLNNDNNNDNDGNINNNLGDDISDDVSEDEEEMNDDGMSGDEEEMEDDMDDVSNDDDASDEEDDDVSDDVSSEEEEDDDEVNEKLRAYELNKLRYYYAVVVCDSSSTANHIYNTLDKTEFLDTSNVFDLRFIPDSMEFNKPPRDVATEVAAGYKEPDFETRALQHSKVKLTWEDDKSDRNKVLRRNFNLDQLDELNIYLASSDSSEDEIEQESKKKAAREKFLSLLKPGNEILDSDEGESEDEREEEKEKEKEKGDMEVTFNTDLEALSRKISDKREKGKEETVWESVLRKKREKRQALKMSQINNDDSNSDDYNSDRNDDDDFFMEEKKGKGKDKGKKREKEKERDNEKLALEREREASRAELELLLVEDTEKNNENKKKGYNMKKKKEKKGKKGKKEKEEESNPRFIQKGDEREGSGSGCERGSEECGLFKEQIQQERL